MNLIFFQEIDVKAGGGKATTIGHFVRTIIEKLEWFDTRFPRIPVNIQVKGIFHHIDLIAAMVIPF